MTTLYDIFKFNNIQYFELTDEAGKKEIEFWIQKIKNTDAAKLLLNEYSGRNINIKTIGMLPENQNVLGNIPLDLLGVICNLAYPSH